MSNNKMIVEERQREIGKFLVGRLLPFRKKRQVGPFTFIDHMGPAEISGPPYMDVDQHPHVGLSTLTYLFKGEVEHKDSAGNHCIVKPGDVCFMTSGSGITHSERTPAHLKDGRTYSFHGYQIWVALPKELEEMEPRLDFIPADEIPTWEEDGMKLKLVAGHGFGKESPLKGYSDLFMVDVYSEGHAKLDLQGKLSGEVAIVVVSGSLEDEGERIEQGQMLISKTNEECCINMEPGSHVLLFGGQPLPEERFLMWNFVSSRKERLQQARQDWKDKNFPMIEGDNTYIPFPDF
ncbi:MAG: pirin family protein [Bacteroidia bacterium]|nr:pirin family protein [Bacteroidia bacterium]